jgi:hypothetical protein
LAHLFTIEHGMCCFEGCQQNLIQADAKGYRVFDIGEAAHIVAQSPRGPRGDPGTSEMLRSDESNLMLMCPTHHMLVDKDPGTYTPEILRDMKLRKERFVQETFQKAMMNVTLVEIEDVAQHLISMPSPATADFHVVPPLEKIARNSLADWPREQLTLGIPRSREVGRYLIATARTDPEFPERVKAGFLTEYRKLWAAGLRGDDLFQGVYRFATGGSNDYRRIAAGLAILAYLFEACEVFDS